MLHVERLSKEYELRPVLEAWRRLADGVPMRGPAWLLSWWRAFALESHELYVVIVRDGDNVLAVAPWFLQTSSTRGRQVAFLGSGEACTDYLTVLCDAARREEVLSALAQWMVDANRLDRGSSACGDRWDLLELNAVCHDDENVSLLAVQLESLDQTIFRQDGEAGWRTQLPSTWDEYVENLSKNRRKKIRRMIRQQGLPLDVESWTKMINCDRPVGSSRLRFWQVKTQEDIARGMQALIDLHQRNWRARGEPGCFASPRFESFLKTASSELLREDALGIYVTYYDQQPIAVEYQLLGREEIYAYQLGVECDLREMEPGNISTALSIYNAILTAKRGFDFMRGDEPYKSHWRAVARPMVDLRVIAGHTSARVRHGVWLAKTRAKQLIKSGLAKTRLRSEGGSPTPLVSPPTEEPT